MHRTLPLPLIVSSQALSYEVPLKHLPSTSRLSPAELAQAYRAWWFGPARTGSLIGRTKR
jgi:hypothetical protein